MSKGTQCVRSKKECGGYPAPPRRALPFHEIRIAPKPLANGHQQPLAAAPAPREPVLQLPARRVNKLQHRARPNTPPQTPVVPQSTMILYNNPAPSLRLDQSEGQYFQLFQTRTASELSGFFDDVFWSRTVLQECHSENAIRHAVVALGALYKTLESTHESPPSSPSYQGDVDRIENAFRHWEVALKQYSNACLALGTLDPRDQRGSRTRLMASVLLSCFDSFIGDHKQAILQIQNGLVLLEQVRAERRRAFMAKPEEPVEDELLQMFTRLAIQAKSYDMAFHFPQPYVIRLLPAPANPGSPSSDAGSPVSTHQEPIPDRFASLREARLSWDTLCERIFRFTETMFSYASGDSPANILPASMIQYGMSFKAQIEAWSHAFEPLLTNRTAPGVTSQEKAGISVLKMFQIMAQILYLMTFSDNEMEFDTFKGQFKTIVDLALEVVGDEERRAREKRCPNPHTCNHHKHHSDIFGGYEYIAHHIKPSFSADLGIVPPLYVVATKCRDRVIRRQAIQLLRSSARREGMWDSELVARIGMWVTDIEEEEDLLPSAESPEPRLSTCSPGAQSTATYASSEFEGVSLGPGGNARWDAQRSQGSSGSPQRSRRIIPAEKRILIKACQFDLREHTATIQCGTRGLARNSLDLKTRVTSIRW